MKKYKALVIILTSLLVITSCGDNQEFTPKPKGLNHIELPQQEYISFNEVDKPYSFEYSKWCKPEAYTYDTVKFGKLYKTFNYEDFGAQIHLTYKSLHNSKDTLNSLIDEAFRMANGHGKKAYGIEPAPVKSSEGNFATQIEITGQVPSTYQFFLHDSTDNFLRGVLYFPTSTKNDSLKPVIDFIKQDMKHMIATVEWK